MANDDVPAEQKADVWFEPYEVIYVDMDAPESERPVAKSQGNRQPLVIFYHGSRGIPGDGERQPPLDDTDADRRAFLTPGPSNVIEIDMADPNVQHPVIAGGPHPHTLVIFRNSRAEDPPPAEPDSESESR